MSGGVRALVCWPDCVPGLATLAALSLLAILTATRGVKVVAGMLGASVGGCGAGREWLAGHAAGILVLAPVFWVWAVANWVNTCYLFRMIYSLLVGSSTAQLMHSAAWLEAV